MGKMVKFFVGVLVLSFCVSEMAMAEESFWADTANPWRYLPVARDSDLAQIAKDGYLIEYDVKNISGVTQTRYLSSGARVDLVNGDEVTTSIVDESTGELKTVSITKFICGWKYYTQTTLYDQDGKVMLGTQIDAYEYNTKKYSLTIGNNVPDMARISEAIENLIDKLGNDLVLVDPAAGATDYEIKYKTGAKDNLGNDIYVSQTIKISEADVRTQAFGVLSAKYLCGLLGDKDAKTLAGIVTRMGDFEELKAALIAAKLITQENADKFLKNSDDIEKYLSGENIVFSDGAELSGFAGFNSTKLGEVNGIIEQLMKVTEKVTEKDGRIRAALRSLADNALNKKDESGAYTIKTDTLLKNIGYYNGESDGMQADQIKLISDILLSVEVDVDGRKSPAVSELIKILNSSGNTNSNKDEYAQELEKAEILSEGLTRSGVPQLTSAQIEEIINTIGQSGCPLVYLDENGNILNKLGTSDLYSLKDKACATVMLSNITLSDDDVLAGAEHCLAIFDYWYGQYEGLVDQGYLEDNPLKLSMLLTHQVNGKEYVITQLPTSGLAGVTEEWINNGGGKERYVQVIDGDEQIDVLNPALTEADFRGSRLAYIQTLINAAMEQGMMVGQKEVITVSVTLSDVYTNGKLAQFCKERTYTDADVTTIINGFLANNDRTKTGMSAAVWNKFQNMTLADKRRFVDFLIKATAAGLENKPSFKFEGQTFEFGNGQNTGTTLVFGSESDNGEDTEVQVKIQFDKKHNDLDIFTRDTNSTTAFEPARHLILTDLAAAIMGGEGQNSNYYNLQTYQPIIGAFAISNVTIHSYKSSSSIGGVDATQLLPTSNVPLSIDADTIANKCWGDPAVTGMAIGVYDVNPFDAQGNLIPDLASHLIVSVDNPEALSAYTGDTVYLLVNVGYYTDDAGVVHVQQNVWDNTSKDVQDQVIAGATGVVSDFDTMILSIEVNLQNLQGVDQGSANSREENVAAIQNTLMPSAEITLWGIMNDSQTQMNAYGLGAGPFTPYHPSVDLLDLGFGSSEQMPFELL